jgi:hypothetical protein
MEKIFICVNIKINNFYHDITKKRKNKPLTLGEDMTNKENRQSKRKMAKRHETSIQRTGNKIWPGNIYIYIKMFNFVINYKNAN